MKYLLFLVCIIRLSSDVFCQSADDLWLQLQKKYQNISNYIDEGEYVQTIFGDHEVNSSYFYFVAVDSNQNVNHWITKKELWDIRSYEYVKAADQEKGSFIRTLKESQTLSRTFPEACASLYGVGGGILEMVASLMFPGLYEDDKGDIPIIRYDSLMRQQDTIINGIACHVLEEYTSYFKTRDMIEDQRRAQDSILDLHQIAYEFRTYPDQEPHTIKFMKRYFIRHVDGLICRREVFLYDRDGLSSQSSLRMNPQSDVVLFETHLKNSLRN